MIDPRPISEDAIHFAVADMLRFKGHGALLWYHVPNGEIRTGRAGAKLKRMGTKPGIADFALTLPDGRSAFLEIKNDKGRQSPEQKAFQTQCERLGIPYSLVRSSQEAEAVLWSWGALKGPAPVSREAA